MMQQNNGLDKNQLIGFVVFTLFLLGVMLYFQKHRLGKSNNKLPQSRR